MPCRGDAVAAMDALLSMSLVDVMGVAVDPSRLSTAFCRVVCTENLSPNVVMMDSAKDDA